MNNVFPSMSDLEFLKSVDGLPDSDIKYYLSVGIINADQAKQLGYVVPQAKPSATPKPQAKPSPVANNAKSNSFTPNSNAPTHVAQPQSAQSAQPQPTNK